MKLHLKEESVMLINLPHFKIEMNYQFFHQINFFYFH